MKIKTFGLYEGWNLESVNKELAREGIFIKQIFFFQEKFKDGKEEKLGYRIIIVIGE